MRYGGGMEGIVELFRPVGQNELALIEQSGFTAFPPRLPEQPIFYPVLTEKYAIEIASRWNAIDVKKGYVTRFTVSDEYISKFDIQTVGASYHREYWIPAEELEVFNDNILGLIDVIHEFGSDS